MSEAPDIKVRGFNTKRSSPMRDTELKAVLNHHITTSINFFVDRYSRSRIDAERYYEALPETIPSPPGRSSIISRDFAESVDILMAGLMRIFSSGDQVVRFVAQKPEDEAYAAQATDYVNYIWQVRNKEGGFKNFVEWFKSALMFRLGVLKVFYNTEQSVKEEEYENMDENDYQALMMEPNIEVLEISKEADPVQLGIVENHLKFIAEQMISQGQTPDPDQMKIDPKQLPQVYKAKVRRCTERGFIDIQCVPVEEFLMGQYKTSIRDREFLGHRRRMSASQLREMGYDEDLINEIPFGNTGAIPHLQEKYLRFQAESTYPYNTETPNDPSSLETWITECYLYVDEDADGVAEFRKIVVGGEGKLVILRDEMIDSHPFAVITPVIMPWKVIGTSLYDQVRDIQQVKTTVMRQMLDNFYQSNHQRLVVNRTVKLDDILNPRPGAPIRVDGQPGEAVMPLTVQPMAQEGLEVLQYMDQVRESRSGVSRMGTGMDPNALQDVTATSVNLLQQAGAARTEMIAKTFAETGVKDAFRKILDLSVKHQTKTDIIELRGQLVPMRPRDWRWSEFDVVCDTGIGTGNRDQQLGHMAQFVPIIQQLVEYQAQTHGPTIVTPTNIFNFLSKMLETAGIRHTERYFTDPSREMQMMQQQPQQQQQMPPEMMQKQAELMEKKREFDAKHGLAVQKTQGDMQLKRQQLMTDFHAKMQELDLEALKIHHNDQNADKDREVSALDIHHKSERDNMRAEVEALKIHHQDINKANDRDMQALQIHHDNRNKARDRAQQEADRARDNMNQAVDRHHDMMNNAMQQNESTGEQE